ncbi:MAG: radical SAM protein [Candidatus Diapherotrites archaeon]
MNTLEKLELLGGGAKFDACGSGKAKRNRKETAALNRLGIFNCTASEDNCRVMKVLYSNSCTHDCKYCANSTEAKKGRQKAMFEPLELAKTVQQLYGRGLFNGLFLSSAVTKDTEFATEKIIETARLLREKMGFNAYMHLKVLPGASREQVKQLALYADRLSVNIESPRKSFFSELSSTKDYKIDLLRRMRWAKEMKEKGLIKSGHTTQMIVGGAGENDSDYIHAMKKMYTEMDLNRVYFSAFTPIEGTALEGAQEVPSLREHRLYQSDWLMRKYNYAPERLESVLNEKGNLELKIDPKILIARKENFSAEIENSGFEQLVQVPGIGPKTAENIIAARKKGKSLSLDELRGHGVIVKRALPFLEFNKTRQLSLGEFGA